jgi:Tfp pilus assembly protein PilF
VGVAYRVVFVRWIFEKPFHTAESYMFILLLIRKIPQLRSQVKRWLPHLLLFLGLHIAVQSAFSQPTGAEKEAWQLAQEARERIVTGDFRVAAEKYSRAFKLCPNNLDYQIGLAHARYFLKEYTAAMELSQPLMMGRKARAEAFQVYGNCQDAQGQSYEALETYRKGLKRFPNAGMLYMEMGIVEFGRKRDAQALQYWEQGIVAQPTYPSNYYFAAKRLFEQGDYAWAANYAELFINLERIGDRVREMSKLFMQAHERARHFDYEKAFRWHFFQVKDTATGLPLPAPRYHLLLDSSFTSEFTDTATKISIANLLDIRRFVCHWLPQQLPDNPARGLLDWQQLIVQAGHLEAYHYWLLYDARQEEFLAWFEENQPRYEAFEGWFLRNTFHRHVKRAVVRPTKEKKEK